MSKYRTKEDIKMHENIAKLKKLVDEQTEDDGLWFIAATAPDAYLQKALRELHKQIEGL